ncbi:MAG TPA: response regulator [Planctomycetaceae bacterium]|nr:response regulator [Planctomycetaceae bacterium]
MSAPTPITVIAIDDDADDLYMLERALAKVPLPLDILRFPTPDEAAEFFVKLAASDLPAPLDVVVFCDIKMPRINGFEIVEHLRSHKKFDGFRVYMLSSSNEPVDRSQAAGLGADGYYQKFPSVTVLTDLLTPR